MVIVIFNYKQGDKSKKHRASVAKDTKQTQSKTQTKEDLHEDSKESKGSVLSTQSLPKVDPKQSTPSAGNINVKNILNLGRFKMSSF